MEARADEVIVPVTSEQAEPVKGARPEPEEIPVKRRIDVTGDAPTKLNTGQVVGNMKTFVAYETTAHEAATLAGAKCHLCRYWDHAAWQQTYRKCWNDKGGQAFLNSIRGRLISVQNDETDDGQAYDLETEVQGSFGICRPFTERRKDTTVTHAMACCPERDEFGEVPVPFFAPRDTSGKKLGAQLYDKVLRLAGTGKTEAKKIISTGTQGKGVNK